VPVNLTLATYSNTWCNGAMAAYTVAMIAFAVSFAAQRGRDLVPAGAASSEGDAGGSVAVATKVEYLGPAGRTTAPSARTPCGNIGLSTTYLGTILLGVGVLFRGPRWGACRGGNMCEFSMTSAFAIALTFSLALAAPRPALARRLRHHAGAAHPRRVDDVPVPEDAQLVPALKSYWLVIHVSAAMICGAAFCIGATVTLLFPRGPTPASVGTLPAKGYRLDWLARRLPKSYKLDADGLPHPRVHVPAVDVRDRGRRDLGRERLGAATGAGTPRRKWGSSPGSPTPPTSTRAPPRAWKGRKAAVIG